MKTKFFISKSFLLLIVLSLVSCAKKDNSTTKIKSVQLIESEQLISLEEAALITSNSYTTKKVTENKVVGQKICTYLNERDGLFQITLTQKGLIPPNCGLKDPKAFYESSKQLYSDIEDISGVGDQAFYSKSPSVLNILCKDHYITISIIRENKFKDGDWEPNDKKAIFINAGKKACENLIKILNK